MADGLHGVKANAAAGAVYGGQRRTRHFFACLLVERVSFGERNHGGILPRRTQRALLHERLGVAAGEISQIADFHRTLGSLNVGDRRGLGDRA